MKNEIYLVILKRDVYKTSFLDSKDKAMKYVTQIEKKKRADLQNKFDKNSSLTLEKHRLYLAFVCDTRMAIVDSFKNKYF